MNSKQILESEKRQSIIQRIDVMKSSLCASKIKDKLSRFHYFGYPNQIPDLLIGKIPFNNINYDSKIAIVNDFGLEVISKLIELGYSNLYILCTEENDKLYSIIEYMIEKEFQFDSDKIVRLTNISMNDKFDLVIANPPYGDHCALGNKITKEILNISKEQIILMPLKGWKANSIYKNIQELELIDGAAFEDAFIPDLALAKSTENLNPKIDNWLDDIILNYIVDKNLFNFYKYNYESYERDPKFTITFGKNKQDLEYDPKKFFITYWTPQNGVHTEEGSKDIQYNLKHNNINMSGSNTDSYLTFKSAKEVENLCDWWYNSELVNILLKGMKQSITTTDTIKFFIPNIDWSKTDIEYTDEYILLQLGLEILKDSGDIIKISKIASELNNVGFNTSMELKGSDTFGESTVKVFNNFEANLYKIENKVK